MITLTKTLIGLSALVSAGAMTMVAPPAATPPHGAAPALVATGKIADRLPGGAAATPTGPAAARIRIAHGEAPGAAAPDCRSFSWPHIPAGCLTANGAPARAVRVISTVGAAAAATSPVIAQPQPAPSASRKAATAR
jgi:hypothetical protein